jgi:hypothetical protein
LVYFLCPYEYKDTLSEAVAVLNSYGIPTSVYNHQLCTVNADVTENYRRSISDWKTEFSMNAYHAQSAQTVEDSFHLPKRTATANTLSDSIDGKLDARRAGINDENPIGHTYPSPTPTWTALAFA